MAGRCRACGARAPACLLVTSAARPAAGYPAGPPAAALPGVSMVLAGTAATAGGWRRKRRAMAGR